MKARPLYLTKYSKCVLALAGLSIFPLASQASLQIKLDDGTSTLIVLDNSSLDLNGSISGINTINQAMGNWLVNVVSTANLGSTATSPLLSLTSFNVSFTGPGAATTPLKIFLTDTGYGPTPGLFNLHIGGSQNGTATVTSKFFYDNSAPQGLAFGLVNQLGTTQTFSSASYSNDQVAGPGGIISSPYSLTIEADISNVPSGNFTSQFTSTLSTAVVPLPGAIWLFGTGLMGLIAGRRKITSSRLSA